MKVSGIISAYTMERIDDIVDLLESLKNPTYKNFEIIFVVDGDKNLMKKMKPYIDKIGLKNIKIVCLGKNKGLSSARNAGVHNASGEIIAFIDDDAIADSEWVKEIVSSFKKYPDVCGVTGYNEALWVEGDDYKWFPSILNWMIGDSTYMYGDNITKVDNLHGNNMAYKREVFEKYGYFSEEFGKKGNLWLVDEDTEFGRRIHKGGEKLLYIPSIKIKHKVYPYRVTLKNIIKRAYYEGFSKAYLEKKLGKALGKENSYLKTIIFKYYPKTFLKLFKSPKTTLKQMFVVFLVVLFVGLGYFHGMIYNKNS